MAKGKKIDFKYNLRVYWSVLKNYKGLLFFVLFLTLLIEATYTVDKFLFKEIIDKGSEFIGGTLPKETYQNILVIVLLVFFASVITRAIGRWINLHVFHKLESNLIVDIKRKFFSHILHLSHNFHTTNKTGSLISRLVRGGSAVERMTDLIVFNVAPLFFQVIVVGAALLVFDIRSGLVLFVTAIIFILYSFTIQKIQEESNITANETEDVEKANISDFLTNIDSIKYFGKEKAVKKRFERLSETTKRSMVRNWNYFRW